MNLSKITPKQSLNKAFLKQRPLRSEIDLFKANLLALLGKINENETEENQKADVRDFLRETFYKSDYAANTKGRQDLAIHTGKTSAERVGVIVEFKRSKNKSEMISFAQPNAKALHELILYYLRERVDENNIDVKYCVITNVYEWFIFDASDFDRLFYKNTKLVKEYKEWRDGVKVSKNTDIFYSDIVKPFIEDLDETVWLTHFDLRDFKSVLIHDSEDDDKELVALYKILSPFHLLRVPFADDSNSLKEPFYRELLHIIGLEEVKDGSKSIIRRKLANKRNAGSLLENTINTLETEDCLHKVKTVETYGATHDERLFNVALELCIVWINRILFLKLLEAQLVNYHLGDKQFRFLNAETVADFDELNKLFFQVLAKTPQDRRESVRAKYARVPYLNSSLFEISELEDATVRINSLDNSETLELINTTVLRELKKTIGSLKTLEYLFRFLDAYDFDSEGTEDIQEDSKTLINASVLGKVFEKINGYKDGSIFTPGFITMYMCRQAIRLAVVQKFRESTDFDSEDFADLKNYLAKSYKSADVLKHNAIINSLRLCDPAVGSGHFLVSSLNEIIAIKSELGILADETGARLSDFTIEIANDELIVTDERGDIFEYQIKDGKPLNPKAQRLQKTLFHEKQTIIENCLFGVDINPNSVKICRLRLWIELLKNAYYKDSTNFAELETLPNIGINIKQGNSLISRYSLNVDLSEVLKQVEYSIEDYKDFVKKYKKTRDRIAKKDFDEKIKHIKQDFKVQLNHLSPERKDLADLENQLRASKGKQFLFGEDEDKKVKRLIKEEKLRDEIAKQKEKIKQTEENVIYQNSFEWRFEFPEVLNNDGDFQGFDLIIGNPPYIFARENFNESIKEFFTKNYKTS